jgi:hypothetical protein
LKHLKTEKGPTKFQIPGPQGQTLGPSRALDDTKKSVGIHVTHACPVSLGKQAAHRAHLFLRKMLRNTKKGGNRHAHKNGHERGEICKKKMNANGKKLPKKMEKNAQKMRSAFPPSRHTSQG